MPLTLAPLGGGMKVSKILADDKTKRHLENLGILSGAEIIPLSNTGGNMIIKILNGKLALDKSLAIKILVA